MVKFLFKLGCIFFLALSSSAIGEDQSQTQNQTPTTENFFETEANQAVNFKGAFTKMMLTLLGLILLIVISVWMLRRISHGRLKQMNYGRSIKILERRPLSAKSVLYLVEISGKKVVIAESQLEVRKIIAVDHLTPDD